ncbi:hypothetical protein OEZ86_001535 [Tetradesmus obliquus]|nr:hypothetical protein OEZ86_001535 [Tetradesmus obliquus]
MLATGSLNGRTLAAGIVGDATLKPYGILILFMALAYISTSLDMTGCFGWLALHITRRSKGNGRLLFLLYFAVSSIITVFTSNDIAIMTLTPIIYYFSAATGTDAVPYLTAMFTAANIWSMLLFVGNPTNIIVAVAYQMSFGDYSRWMALPTLGAGLGCLAVLLLVHARRMPKHLALPDLQPALLLLDKPGAAFGSFNILGCLGLLAAAPSLGWELWPVTLVVPFVLGMFILVEGLNATGWVDRLAWWLGSGVRGSVWAALFAVGSFSVLLANLANNQPMTILMTRVCMSPVFAQAAAAAAAGAPAAGGLISSGSSSNADLSSPTSMASMADGSSRVPIGAAFAVVIASNVAANFTVMGALAGIMFVNILQRKGLRTVNYATFSRLMLPSGLVSAVLALAILGAELVLWQ